ncbi:uncharacterized protein LOC131689544 [Topomyia yanbarensis]|uniref:uncharacterized protein LOC131689544 n=1 Tax=Topomyia yanbarensis TaxID=2498891 RepID=UPI00273C8DA7|nr:uncharacterized protein LOC131689544 [Topomyia yanbarensis]
MTMSQLLKQTKKCCVKMIRKLSFHPNGSSSPPSSGGVGGSTSLGSGGIGGSRTGGRSISLNNRATTKYVLHKNCTPTRCKVQPTSPDRFAARATSAASWTSGGTDESPGVRRRLDLSPKPEVEIPPTQNNYRVSRDGKNLPKKRTNICSNKNVNLRKCFRLRKGFSEELDSEEVNNSSSVVSSKLDKISKTLYNVAGGSGTDRRNGEVVYSENKLFGGGVNANNLASQTSEKSKISKPLFLSGKHKKYNQIETEFGADDEVDFEDGDDDEFVACELDVIREGNNSYDGGRLQFELSQPLPELDVSPFPDGTIDSYDDIVFEKVKYDRNKRYLRNGTTSSPSTASNRSHNAESTLSASFDAKPDHHLSQFADVTSKSEDYVDPWKNYNVSSRWNKVAKNPWEFEAQRVESPAMSPLRQTSWNPFTEVPAESSTPPHQLIGKTYPPPYQVRTDIWQNLNNKNYEIDSDVIWRTSNSSRRTSASTVETWIEDEVFDNSFNEELERRCATLKI